MDPDLVGHPRRRPGRVSGEGPCALALVLITFLGRPQRRRPGRPRGAVPAGRRSAGCTDAFRWARLCVRACVCACRMGQADTGGLEGRRGEALSARDSARIAPSYVDVGAWRGRGPRAMGPIAEAESGPSRRRDSGSPLISLCLRWDGVPRASPSAAVRMCCALVRSALTVVRSKRCVAGFRCRASCGRSVAPRSRGPGRRDRVDACAQPDPLATLQSVRAVCARAWASGSVRSTLCLSN